MADSNDTGNHLQEEIAYGTCTADEPDLDISILFAEPGPDEPQAQTHSQRNVRKPRGKCKTPDSKLQSDLFWALKYGRYEEFVNLLEGGKVKLNYAYSEPKYKDNGTCLEIASRLPDGARYVKALLDCGMEPNVNRIFPEPIHYAAKSGNPETIEILLRDKRTNINATDSDGRTALHLAIINFKMECKEKYAKCINLLLSRPEFDINKQNKKGHTAIYVAADKSKEILQLLLEKRSHDWDLDTHRVKGRTTREFISHKYDELINSLPDTNKEKQISNLDIQLLRSLLGKNLDKFKKILQQIDEDGNARVNPNIFYGKPHNATCLEIACWSDECVEFVKLLLRAGANPNTVNSTTKETALHSALQRGNHKVSSVLLKERKTNVNASNKDGKSVLHIIAGWTETTDERKHARDILNLVLKIPKVKINSRDSNRQTVAEIALANDNREFLEIMLREAGSFMELDTVLESGNETLREAIRNKYPSMEKKFPNHKHRPTSTNNVITDLFEHLYNANIDDFLNVLKQKNKNIDINAEDRNYRLLQYAVVYDLEEHVRELLKANVNPNLITETERRPPIIIASQKEDGRILRILLETESTIKLDVNVTDIAGNTALHYASKRRDLDSVVALLRRGAKISDKNLFGKSHLPADSIEFFLDESLRTNAMFPNDKEFELIYDYSFLLAYRENHSKASPIEDQRQPLIGDAEANRRNVLKSEKFSPEIDFLHDVSESQEYTEIMEHPVITSFVHIKWQSFKYAYYLNLFIYSLFTSLISVYTAIGVSGDRTNALFDTVGEICICVFLTYFVILEIIRIGTWFKVSNTMFDLLTILDLMTILFTAILAVMNYAESHLIVMIILMSWTQLMLMTSRLHKLSSNIKMLKQVIINYFWLLMSYTFLLIAFGLSFYTVYHAAAKEEQLQRKNNKTENDEKFQFYAAPHLAIIKTVIMMVGEFEANNLLTQMTSNWIGLVLFIVFVFLIPMVLLNLLTGVAVCDTQSIKAKDHIHCLVSRIQLIYDLEKNLLFLHSLADIKPRTPILVRPFVFIFEAMLKHINLFSGTAPDKQNIRIRPNESKYIIIKHNNHKTKSNLDLVTLKKTLEIISVRHEQISDD